MLKIIPGAGSSAVESALLEAFMVRTPFLRRYISQRIPAALQARIEADDVLQEVWVAAFSRASSFREDGPDALDRWLTGITKRRLADILRSAGAAKRGGGHVGGSSIRESCCALYSKLASASRTPSREVSSREAADALMIALGSMPEDRRKVVRMRFLEGHTQQEIADTLGKPGSSINSLLYHALRDLRKRIGDVSRYFSDHQKPAFPLAAKSEV